MEKNEGGRARKRVYLVESTYKVTGSSLIAATSAAEAGRIGIEGYADGFRPQFIFGEPHSETRMHAYPAPDEEPDDALNPFTGERRRIRLTDWQGGE